MEKCEISEHILLDRPKLIETIEFFMQQMGQD